MFKIVVISVFPRWWSHFYLPVTRYRDPEKEELEKEISQNNEQQKLLGSMIIYLCRMAAELMI